MGATLLLVDAVQREYTFAWVEQRQRIRCAKQDIDLVRTGGQEQIFPYFATDPDASKRQMMHMNTIAQTERCWIKRLFNVDMQRVIGAQLGRPVFEHVFKIAPDSKALPCQSLCINPKTHGKSS